MATIIKRIVIPESSSSCNEWIVYFENLRGKFGSQNAKLLWMRTWQANGSTSCTTNADFNKFLKSNGIDVSNAATRLVASGAELGENILGMGISMTSFLKYAGPVFLVVLVGGVIYIVMKSAPDLNEVTSLTPLGRAAKILK